MAKKSRQERREEERRMIAEMEAAMAGNTATPASRQPSETAKPPTPKKKKQKTDYGEGAPEKVHCPQCKTLMDNGVCPTCGHRVYVPMDKKKRDKIRMIVTVACIVGFIVIYLITQFAGK